MNNLCDTSDLMKKMTIMMLRLYTIYFHLLHILHRALTPGLLLVPSEILLYCLDVATLYSGCPSVTESKPRSGGGVWAIVAVNNPFL